MNKLPIAEMVRQFWNRKPCGTWVTCAPVGSLDFFKEIEKYRYCDEPHIPVIAEFEKYRGKDVLEIGCGVGTDLVQFAKFGARVTGIDLSDESIRLAKKRLELLGLQGNFLTTSAEDMPWGENSFDLVYSYGVLHHIPEVEKVVQEIYRVLRPGGRVIVIVYHKNSLIFYYNFILIQGILKGKLFKQSLTEIIAEGTDGKGNPYSKLYTKQELRRLFEKNGFRTSQVGIVYLQHQAIFTPVGKYFTRNDIPRPLIKILDWLGKRVGWYLYYYGIK